MRLDERINCTLCIHLAGDRCTYHDVELDNPAFTLCSRFQLPDEVPETMTVRFPQLQELNPECIYETDLAGEVSPLLQVARKRRQRPRTTGVLPQTLEDLPEVDETLAHDRRDRFVGAMLGIGIGDALGFPAEGRSPSEVEMIYGAPLTGMIARIGRRHSWPIAQVTTPTQLTLALGESLMESERLDLDDFAERLVRWLPNALRAGKSTTQSVQALTEGRHWSVSGVESNGSGSSVRMVPLALFHHTDYALLRQEAILQSMPTHTGETAYAGAVLFGTAIASLVNTPAHSLNRADFLNLLERVIRGIDSEMSAKLHEVASLLAEDAHPAEALARMKTGGYVAECLPSALYCFLYHAENPERALLAAANGGFDASSVAAMTGALLGAYHGRNGLPRQWDHELPLSATLADLGARLHGLVSVQDTVSS